MPTISDWIQIAVSIFLGFAALVFARFANKLNKQANKIAVNERIYKIFNFFNSEISEPSFFDFSIEMNKKLPRIKEIENDAYFLFDISTFKKIQLLINNITSFLQNGEFSLSDSVLSNTLNPENTIKILEAKRKKEFINDIQEKTKVIFEQYRLNK